MKLTASRTKRKKANAETIFDGITFYMKKNNNHRAKASLKHNLSKFLYQTTARKGREPRMRQKQKKNESEEEYQQFDAQPTNAIKKKLIQHCGMYERHREKINL